MSKKSKPASGTDDTVMGVVDSHVGMIRVARMYAEQRHGHTRRQDGLTIHHVRNVVENLQSMGVQDASIICAAWLHDTIEDTGATYTEICKEFGSDVADTVSSLSHDNRLPLDLMVAEYTARLGSAGEGVKTIKLADILSNLESLSNSDADSSEIHAKAGLVQKIKIDDPT